MKNRFINHTADPLWCRLWGSAFRSGLPQLFDFPLVQPLKEFHYVISPVCPDSWQGNKIKIQSCWTSTKRGKIIIFHLLHAIELLLIKYLNFYTVSMPAISMSTTITIASLGDIPRIRISSKMLGSSSESAGRFLMSSNVLLMYLIDVLKIVRKMY